MPIKKWTRDYKNMLEDMMMEGELIEDVLEFHKDNTVDFEIKLKKPVKTIEKDVVGGVNKLLKLNSLIHTTNYVLFDSKG